MSVFALWTLSCHAVVAAGGNLYHVLGVFSVLAVGATIWRWRTGAARGEAWEAPPPTPPRKPNRIAVRGAGFVAAMVGTWLYARSGDVVLLWWWLVGLLGLAAVATARDDAPRLRKPAGGRRREQALFVLAFAAAVFALVCHRPDADDSLYVNMAVAAADRPQEAILAFDTLHGIPNLPLHLPVYRVHSFELWQGAVSFLTGIPAIYCFHLLTTAVAAFLVPCALAVFYRVLLPHRWLWAVAATLLVLVSVGGPHRWHGNFSLVRIWQGKSVFLFVLLPLIYAYAMRFALAPGRRAWWRLAAAQVAAIGSTSSALWLAPLSSGIALLAALPLTWRALRTLIPGLLSSAYVFGAGLAIWIQMSSSVRWGTGSAKEAVLPLAKAFETVLGEPALVTFSVGTLLAAWTLYRGGLSRRFLLLTPLLVALFLWAPGTAPWIRGHVTGPAYWRSFWALPLPFLMALVLVAPLAWRPRGRRLPGRLATLAAAVLFAVLVPRYPGWSPENQVRLGWPGLKVPQPEYAVAKALLAAAGSGARVVAPPEVSTWMTTFHHPAFPVQVRVYLRDNERWLGRKEVRRRERMSWYAAGGRNRVTRAAFQQGLRLYGLRAACLRRMGPKAEALLAAAGFRRTLELEGYEIWVATSPPSPASPPPLVPRPLAPAPPPQLAPRPPPAARIFEDGFEDGKGDAWKKVGS